MSSMTHPLRLEGREIRRGRGAFLVPLLGLRGSSGDDSRLRVRVCRLLDRLLLWCHEFGGVLVFWCWSSYPLCVGYWLLQHSANSVLDCAFLLVFGAKVATFIWTCLGTRAGWRSTPLFPRWHSTCHGIVQFVRSSSSLLWRRGISPWSSGFPSCRTLGGRRPCCGAAARFTGR